jgi:hypothetical protein
MLCSFSFIEKISRTKALEASLGKDFPLHVLAGNRGTQPGLEGEAFVRIPSTNSSIEFKFDMANATLYVSAK